jgi:hypothetical protein
MISFDNYNKSGTNVVLKWGIFIALVALAGYLTYRILLAYLPDLFGPGPVIGQAAAAAGKSAAKTTPSVSVNTGYGYSADAWDPQMSSILGAHSTENVDPSNAVQKFSSHVDPVTGKTVWTPNPMQNTQDYITKDEFDVLVDRYIPGYNKAQLDYMTQPSFIRNADNFFGLPVWPNDDGTPLSNLRGACVNPEDIAHRGGLFNSDSSKWGQSSIDCMY